MRQIEIVVPTDHETGSGGGANSHCAHLALNIH
jgi:hypothetical protein